MSLNLLSRRRSMMLEENNGGGYITDGLVFHLDGINRGTTDTSKWVDLVGGIEFTLVDCTVGTNYVQFNGSTSESVVSSDTNHSTGTIECVAQGAGFAFSEYNGLCARLSSNDFCHHAGANGRVAYVGLCNSGNTTTAVINGIERSTANSSNQSVNNQTQMSIGRRYYGTNGQFFNGKIFSIRIYNRQLTAEEMIQNQKYDNVRFNLGLTLE